MIIGIFITTHIFHLGVNTALIVNMITNAIPLYWFLIKKPIPNFFKKGFEFDFKEIKRSWKIVKWELVRRMAPRVSAIIGVSLMIVINPIYAGVKYWISNLFTFVEGWIDAMAGLLNSHVSRNVGLKVSVPQKDNEYIFIKSAIGTILTIIFIYFCAKYLLWFLPESIYNEILNPLIYIFAFFEFLTKLRYYMWLSISRSYKTELNGKAQLFYALPTAFLTPLLLWLFLHKLNLGIEYIFLTGAIVGTIQWILTEIYFRNNLNKRKRNI